VTGVTVHLVDEGVDTGPILAQKAVEVRPGDTLDLLRQRIQRAERRLYWKTLAALFSSPQ
jgi:folate-dependent phosphoribosylglycinamide formyltransferase PurN